MVESSVVRKDRDKLGARGRAAAIIIAMAIWPLCVYGTTFYTDARVIGCGWLLFVTCGSMAVSWLCGIYLLWRTELSEYAKASFSMLFSFYVAFLCAHRFLEFLFSCFERGYANG